MSRSRTIASGGLTDDATTSTNFSTPDVYVLQDGEDAAIVRRCLDGDTDAFARLVERYQRVLFTVALRFLGDRDAAADAAQSAFVKAFEKLGTFDPQRRFFSWIYRIAVNECLNVRRGTHPTEPLDPAVALGSGPYERFEAEERRRRVQAALVDLPHDYREVVVLRYFAGLSYEEIADAVGVANTVVKSRLYTARQRLSQKLSGMD